MSKKKDKKKSSSKKAPDGIKIICQNKKARFNYELVERFEAGLVLMGSEIKSLRAGKANLTDAYADIRKNELYLIQANIEPYDKAGYVNHEPKRARKLLLHRQEIKRLIGKIQTKGMALVPLKFYLKQGKAKVELALATGKKAHDKRQTIKERDLNREMRRELKIG
jgi:SsrA-binding protein